jgi:hypothetical protein
MSATREGLLLLLEAKHMQLQEAIALGELSRELNERTARAADAIREHLVSEGVTRARSFPIYQWGKTDGS